MHNMQGLNKYQGQHGCLPEASRILRRTLRKASNDASLGVGPHSNDQGPAIALQHFAATQQERLVVGILQDIVSLASQLALVHPACHAM